MRRVGPRDVAAIAGERSPFCCLTLAARERIIVRDAGAGVPPSAGLEILRAGDLALVCYRWGE